MRNPKAEGVQRMWLIEKGVRCGRARTELRPVPTLFQWLVHGR